MHNYITYSQSLWVSRMDKAILRGFSFFMFYFYFYFIFILFISFSFSPTCNCITYSQRPVGVTYGQGIRGFSLSFSFFIFRHLRPESVGVNDGQVNDGQGQCPVSPGCFFLFSFSHFFCFSSKHVDVVDGQGYCRGKSYGCSFFFFLFPFSFFFVSSFLATSPWVGHSL
jgi:hypothetical protein